ncbi:MULTISPECIES: DMT family transporter [unclassified Shewanella]|uniref:DMT family transporter n=1 Tax=unclassified Shewanella TaxID=196818 RepID=UPI000CB6AE65|nr:MULTISPECIES: DMT family transporter [unclassified Shewanella]MDO6641435.1 DMT family transporter [Shewanella sp. 5_MG-2023]MDO6679797.1 DMT family transporter [Shewanella sp. 4_MG-2023]MDO6776648.1 DMT family transporter [Shewanella sp. 3_MG-2023]PMG41579.1 permease [Shewanella sp. 10N.286.52.B9]PMH85393.1 permease [Shewanella sp. 10N.286.48.B5]
MMPTGAFKGSNPNSGLIQLHIAVLLFGGTALFSKIIPLNALDITVLRCVIAFFALGCIVKLSKKKLQLQQFKHYLVALGLGILVSLHWVTYFASMQLSSVAIGMIAFFTYPVMTVLIEPLVNNTRLKLVDVISGLVVLIGVMLLIPEANLENDVTLGIATGILSAALFTGRNLLHKRYFSGYSGPQAMFYQTFVAVVVLSPWLEVELDTIKAEMWTTIVILGVFFTAAPHALFASALRQLSAKTVGLVSCLQPFYGTVLALLLLNEQVNVTTTVGGLIILATAIFETQQNHKKNKA